jgi:NAD(P)-dependent dehydrogenase (short-subunit alcohol dehydrogenase family)
MRILVIGGNGFIGSPLVRELRDSGHEVAVFHRRRDAGLGDVEQIQGGPQSACGVPHPRQIKRLGVSQAIQGMGKQFAKLGRVNIRRCKYGFIRVQALAGVVIVLGGDADQRGDRWRPQSKDRSCQHQDDKTKGQPHGSRPTGWTPS